MIAAIDETVFDKQTFSGSDISISLGLEDNLTLERVLWDGKNMVVMMMPWHDIYTLGTYSTQTEANSAYNVLLSQLTEGYTVHILDAINAELIPPKQ